MVCGLFLLVAFVKRMRWAFNLMVTATWAAAWAAAHGASYILWLALVLPPLLLGARILQDFWQVSQAVVGLVPLAPALAQCTAWAVLAILCAAGVQYVVSALFWNATSNFEHAGIKKGLVYALCGGLIEHAEKLAAFLC